jgi:outer membrane protein assembly factor BamD
MAAGNDHARMISTKHALKGLALAVVLTVLSAGFSGCASSGVTGAAGGADADKVLIEGGNAALAAKKWAAARQYFTKLLDGYPQSPYRADAKLGVGDSYLGEGTTGSYVFALNEFREFLAFYPTNPRADYAQYQLGMTHYQQMLAPGRDQTETKEAVREFQTFVDHYSNSSRIADGRKRLRESKDRLDDAELGVGLFYLHIKYYAGAMDRFRGLLQSDPEYTHKDSLYFNLADILERVDKKPEALPYYERLVAEFEQSQYLEEAKRRIALLKAAPGAGL